MNPPARIRPGVMAVTIGCQFPKNNGNVVRVVHRHANTPEWDFKSTPSWWCESGRPMQWKQPDGKEIVATEGPIPEAKLLPLDGGRQTMVQPALVGIPRSLLIRSPSANCASYTVLLS